MFSIGFYKIKAKSKEKDRRNYFLKINFSIKNQGELIRSIERRFLDNKSEKMGNTFAHKKALVEILIV
ncbi:MAG: hypothetical protein AAGE96_05635 [Cyanobacteria bacterium P01_G01_bin.19]